MKPCKKHPQKLTRRKDSKSISAFMSEDDSPKIVLICASVNISLKPFNLTITGGKSPIVTFPDWFLAERNYFTKCNHLSTKYNVDNWIRQRKKSPKNAKNTYFGFDATKLDLSELAMKPWIRNNNTRIPRHFCLCFTDQMKPNFSESKHKIKQTLNKHSASLKIWLLIYYNTDSSSRWMWTELRTDW